MSGRWSLIRNKNAGRVTATAAGADDLNIFIMKVKAIRPNLPSSAPLLDCPAQGGVIIRGWRFELNLPVQMCIIRQPPFPPRVARSREKSDAAGRRPDQVHEATKKGLT